MAFWNTVEQGEVVKVYNTYRKFGSADMYEAGWIKRNGKLVRVAFTASQLDDAEITAAKNPEDMPKLKTGIWGWLKFGG